MIFILHLLFVRCKISIRNGDNMFNRIYIEITNICNLNCDFCPATKRIKKSISVSDFEKIILKVKDYTNHIYLHVKGEPLMHPELDDILKIVNKYNLNVNVTTNGRLLSNKLDIINSNKVRQLNISLHSYDNLNEIEELLNTIDKIHNSYISLRLWNNKDNSEVLSLLEKHYNVKINITGNRFKINDKIFIDKDVLFSWPDLNNEILSEYGTCKAKRQLAILVDGTVVPCCLDNDGVINLGNIFESSIEDIINSDRYKNMINGFNNNKLVEELCKKCGYRNRFN